MINLIMMNMVSDNQKYTYLQVVKLKLFIESGNNSN
jgi:hypothetical protein